VLAGLATTPIAAFADAPLDPIPTGIPSDSVTVSADHDGSGTLFTLTKDVSTVDTITMPNDATLDGAGHTITAVEDADHPNFPGAVLASQPGSDSAPAHLDVENLDIATQGFQGGGKNSGGLLTGISMLRTGGSLTNVSVDGISHGNGVQEGNAIAIRNRVSGDNIDVPRAKVTLDGVEVSNYQKTGILLDGNLSFSVTNAHVGQGMGPEGEPNPTIAANSLQISRGASGSVSDSSFALNSHEEATGVLLYNARNVAFDGVTVAGDASATSGIYVLNSSNTIDTAFSMRGGAVTRTATPAAGTGVVVDGPADAITATVTDTRIEGWDAATSDGVTTTTTPAATDVDVTGTYHASRPAPRHLRVKLQAFALGANQAEGKMLRWRIKVDGHRAAAIRQHAGETDVWAQRFHQGTGTHTVEILENGVSQRTFQVHTR
jgi:hypothetical protein